MKFDRLKPPSPLETDALDARKLLLSTIRTQYKIIGALVIAVASLSAGYVALLPLKENTPYVIEVNKNTAEVSVPRQQEAVKFSPSEDNVLYFLRQWLKAEFTIQPQLAVQNEALVLSTLRGDVAINKQSDFRARDKTFQRLKQEPTLVRDVTIDSITPVAGGSRSVVANLTLTTTSRGATQVERKLVTVYYEILPPQTKKDRENHPIGLYIIDFRIADTNN